MGASLGVALPLVPQQIVLRNALMFCLAVAPGVPSWCSILDRPGCRRMAVLCGSWGGSVTGAFGRMGRRRQRRTPGQGLVGFFGGGQRWAGTPGPTNLQVRLHGQRDAFGDSLAVRERERADRDGLPAAWEDGGSAVLQVRVCRVVGGGRQSWVGTPESTNLQVLSPR